MPNNIGLHFNFGSLPGIGSDLPGSGIPFSGGAYWFIDAENGTDGNGGMAINDAVATIGFALNLAQAGDTLVIAPGSYAEGLTVSTDYITFVGWSPSGYARPDILSASGGGFTLNVHAQGFTCKHARFAGSGIGGIGVQQQGNGYLYQDCVFESESNIGFRMLPDQDDDSFTASEGMVSGCLIRDCAGGGMSFENPGPGVEGGVGVTDVVVANCRFYGNTGNDIFDVYAAGGNNQTFTRCLITGCQFLTLNPASYIDLSAGTSNDGLISSNFFAFTTAGGLTSGEIVLGNDIAFSGNFDAVGIVDGHTF